MPQIACLKLLRRIQWLAYVVLLSVVNVNASLGRDWFILMLV
jgi:hypothetical protein